jgi:hypothetical protein
MPQRSVFASYSDQSATPPADASKSPSRQRGARSPWLWFFEVVHYVSIFALLPVCTYIAILRYRLYEIDRLINASSSTVL